MQEPDRCRKLYASEMVLHVKPTSLAPICITAIGFDAAFIACVGGNKNTHSFPQMPQMQSHLYDFLMFAF